MTKLQEHWVYRLQKALNSGDYSDDQFGDLKDEMTDELPQTECEEVFDRLER